MSGNMTKAIDCHCGLIQDVAFSSVRVRVIRDSKVYSQGHIPAADINLAAYRCRAYVSNSSQGGTEIDPALIPGDPTQCRCGAFKGFPFDEVRVTYSKDGGSVREMHNVAADCEQSAT